ncbi:hypothetical protein CW745_11930 [Psychromonas sp. psych-6C06]|uniref:hypothetical protein n=1 Tax=Psychromonas sp. psych-6C06 TaxID=2058089 RepID=UPI000C349B4A|nr:hypothetical protein [Psychromonas sp. psych-6C06]PKF61014.1 hypothetical protein CW745_11930 [Psychromonas sp. psych-6C06]
MEQARVDKPRYDITFLHTGAVHVDTFNELLRPHKLSIKHIVDAELLHEATRDGITPALITKVSALLYSASTESKLVVCSCSTLGSIAENTQLVAGQQAIRIDRAMSDLAVSNDGKILVLAALQSTLEATTHLMQSSQHKLNSQCTVDYQVVDGCWHYFETGDFSRYFAMIAKTISLHQADYDCIVLAQASMAGAIDHVIEKRAQILSSPMIGAQSLLQKLVQ